VISSVLPSLWRIAAVTGEPGVRSASPTMEIRSSTKIFS
jgi:hypothetical protein